MELFKNIHFKQEQHHSVAVCLEALHSLMATLWPVLRVRSFFCCCSLPVKSVLDFSVLLKDLLKYSYITKQTFFPEP